MKSLITVLLLVASLFITTAFADTSRFCPSLKNAQFLSGEIYVGAASFMIPTSDGKFLWEGKIEVQTGNSIGVDLTKKTVLQAFSQSTPNNIPASASNNIYTCTMENYNNLTNLKNLPIDYRVLSLNLTLNTNTFPQ